MNNMSNLLEITKERALELFQIQKKDDSITYFYYLVDDKTTGSLQLRTVHIDQIEKLFEDLNRLKIFEQPKSFVPRFVKNKII